MSEIGAVSRKLLGIYEVNLLNMMISTVITFQIFTPLYFVSDVIISVFFIHPSSCKFHQWEGGEEASPIIVHSKGLNKFKK